MSGILGTYSLEPDARVTASVINITVVTVVPRDVITSCVDLVHTHRLTGGGGRYRATGGNRGAFRGARGRLGGRFGSELSATLAAAAHNALL